MAVFFYQTWYACSSQVKTWELYNLVFSPDTCSHTAFSGKVSAHWEINITLPKEVFSLMKCPLQHLSLQLLAQWLSPLAPLVFIPLMASQALQRHLPVCLGSAQGVRWSHLRHLPGVWMAVLMSLSPESCSVGNHNMWLKKPVKNILESWISYMISYYGSF